MARILVATRPDHDTLTEYIASWIQPLIELANKQVDTVVFDLSGKDASREAFEKIVTETKPNIILLNGHGNKEVVAGFADEVLIKCGENADLTRGSIVHAFACDSAARLGPECVSVGAEAYIGYKEKYWLGHLGYSKGRQCDDPIAKLYLEPAIEVVKALIEGASVNEAYRRSQRMYADNILRMLASVNTDYNSVIASQLSHNFMHQAALGNLDTSIPLAS